MLISVRGCEGWPVPLLFACNKIRFPATTPIYIDNLAWVLTFYLIYWKSWEKEIKCETCRAFNLFFATSSINSIIQEYERQNSWDVQMCLLKFPSSLVRPQYWWVNSERMLYSIYRMTKSNENCIFWRENFKPLPFWTQRYKISKHTSGLSILLHRVISLPDATPCDKYSFAFIVCQNWPETYEYSMTFHSVLVNVRKKCALDCCTITYLNGINQNSPIAQWTDSPVDSRLFLALKRCGFESSSI